ncbi:hypothetical protein FHG87_005018 [Trinorchestia longiramus]|nr:hypothetical protein FHG87_005018 [Trinorchestia longiramus]
MRNNLHTTSRQASEVTMKYCIVGTVLLGLTTLLSHVSSASSLPDEDFDEQIVVLPHGLQATAAAATKDTLALRSISAGLQKKEPPVIKGLLVNKNIGDKIRLIKAQNARKVIDLRKVPGMISSSNKKNEFYNSKNPQSEVKDDKLLSRKKRFISLRNVALPLSIFHYLGFLPMRVPGVPYHIDPGLPDYTVYEPYNDLAYPDPPVRSRSTGKRRQQTYE